MRSFRSSRPIRRCCHVTLHTFHNLNVVLFAVVLAIRLKSCLSLQHIHSRSALECAYRTHLIAGVGFFQHLLLYIQSHYQLELQDCIDWTHVTDPLIGETFPYAY